MTQLSNGKRGSSTMWGLVGALAITLLSTSPVGAARLIATCGPVYEDVKLAADLSTSSQICLDVKANGVTIDGANHSIRSTNLAISINDRKNVVVQSVVSENGLQIYGEQADFNVVRYSGFGWLSIYMGDDNTIQSNILRKFTIEGMYNSPAQRETVIGNVIKGVVTQVDGKIVKISTGTDGTRDADGSPHCAAGDHTIANNWIEGSAGQGAATTSCSLGTLFCTQTAPPPPPEIYLVWFACGSRSTIAGNTIVSPSLASGLLLRDEADNNLIINNRIRVAEGNVGAISIISGNNGYHHPRDNMFRENTFVADRGRVSYLQASAPRGNVFTNNVFATNQGSVETVRVVDGSGVTYVFDHNTFYNGGTGPLVVFRNLGQGSMRFSSNILDTQGGGIYGFDGSASLGSYVGSANLFWTPGAYPGALQGWQNATGQDLNSKIGDPAFVSPTSGDFHLKPESPARAAGENGSDAGAYPYVSKTP